MPILPLVGPYPTYEIVMNLARALVNDTFAGATGTPGEGQIFTDSAPFTIPFLRAVTAELYQELGNTGTGVVIRDNYILRDIPPVQGAWGVGIPDPTIQVAITYTGYSNGKTINPDIYLPEDLVVPLFLWERTSGTNNQFEEMMEVQHALPTTPQTTALAWWEWRGDSIWMTGSLLPKDIRIRYIARLPLLGPGVTDLKCISVPITDCENALALKLARNYGLPRGSDQVQLCESMQQQATFLIKNRFVRAMQTVDFRAEPYGEARLNLFPLDRYR